MQRSRIGLLFTHKNGDFGSISATGRSCTVSISNGESHISDRCVHIKANSFSCQQEEVIRYSLNIAMASSVAQGNREL